MKQKQQLTNQEKIDLFDQVHDMAREELNSSAREEDRDEHYFWEGVMETVLFINKQDWTAHNNGHQF